MLKYEILQLSHNAVPGTSPGNITYYIDKLGRVSSDHKLSKEEFALVKRTVNPDTRDRMRDWPRLKSLLVKLGLGAAIVSGAVAFFV